MNGVVIDPGQGTQEVFTMEQIREKVEDGEMDMGQALEMAYDDALRDMERACANKAREMDVVGKHAHYRAIGMYEVHKCAERLKKGNRHGMGSRFAKEDGMGSLSSKILADAIAGMEGKPIIIMDPKGELEDLRRKK